MKRLPITFALFLLTSALVFALGCPMSTPYDPNPPDRYHTETDFARAKLRGTGKIDGQCTVFTARVYLADSSIWMNNAEQPEIQRRVYVLMERYCCQDLLSDTVWTGETELTEDDFSFHVPPNMSELWSADVNATVTVTNSNDPDDQIDLHLDLNWVGRNDFRIRTEAAFTGRVDPYTGTMVEDIREYSYYVDEWSPAEVEGTISADGIMFITSRQENVRITSRTMDVTVEN